MSAQVVKSKVSTFFEGRKRVESSSEEDGQSVRISKEAQKVQQSIGTSTFAFGKARGGKLLLSSTSCAQESRLAAGKDTKISNAFHFNAETFENFLFRVPHFHRLSPDSGMKRTVSRHVHLTAIILEALFPGVSCSINVC
jgi:hypothetical protein